MLSPSTPLLGFAAALVVTTGAHAGGTPGLFDTSALGSDVGTWDQNDSVWWPTAMTLADFDGDGTPDIATANDGNFLPIAQRLTIAMNRGDGTFGAPASYADTSAAESVATGDFDGDGDPDLLLAATGHFGDDTVILFMRNLGAGAFAAPVAFDVGADGPRSIAVADFDGDGNLDAATANYGWHNGTTVSLLRGLGDGTFAPPQTFAAGNQPHALAAGDFNRDGAMDLVVANGGTGLRQTTLAHVLMNNGTGGFAAPAPLASLVTEGDFSPCVDVIDIDADGDLDILYCDLKLKVDGFGSYYGVAVHRGNGAGAFTLDTVTIGAYTGAFSALDAGDLNGDGFPEIVGAHDANEGWSIIESDGAGGFLPAVELVAGEYPRDIAVADADGDGDSDILVLSYFSQTVSVHYNPGDGDFSPPTLNTVFAVPYHMDSGDIDADGDLDLALSYGYATSGTILILRNNGDGTFPPFASEYIAPVYPSSVKLRDLNGDDLPDLLWADKFPPYSWRSRLNTGGGNFGPTQSWLGTFTCGVSLNVDAIHAADFDGDGDNDVILAENLGCGGGAGPKRLFFHENDGAGDFTLVNIVDMNWPPMEVLSADLDGDGNLDVITAGRTIDVLMGTGNITFTGPVADGNQNVGATNATLGDFNGDGFHDVAVTVPNDSFTSESLGVLYGNGDGTFNGPAIFPGTHSPNLAQHTAITTGDPDGDGDLDIFVGNYAANDISFYENNGDGTFQPQQHIGTGAENTRDIMYADFTGDGVGDLLATVSTFAASGVALVPGRPAGPMHGPGDVDGDGVVSFSDLLAVLSTWGPCAGACPADLDGDGAVTFADLLIVIANWS